MFSELIPTRRKRFTTSQCLSFALHVLVFLVIAYRPRPIFVMPSDVALGTPGSKGTVTYLAPTGAERSQKADEKPMPNLRASAVPKPVLPAPKPTHTNEDGSESAKLDEAVRGGSPYGARIPGAPLTGHEIIPALPQVFPDPAVTRADLPPGVEGDVIVEVTIDERGNVIELKLIHGIGYGIANGASNWRRRTGSLSLPSTSSPFITPASVTGSACVTFITPPCDSHTQPCHSPVYTGSYRSDTGPIFTVLWGLCL